MTVALRQAEPRDEPFMAHVYASTREEELAPVPFSDAQRAAFLAQQFAAQSVHFAQAYPDGSFDVVEVDGQPAGRLIVGRFEREIVVVDIALLPEFRSRGMGTGLMRAILAEADALGKKVTLHVESFNRAQRLYARLGFVPVGSDGVYIKMERSGEDGLVAGAAGVAADRHQEDLERPETVVLEPVDALLEHRLAGTAEGEREGRAPAVGVDSAGVDDPGARAGELQVQPRGAVSHDEAVADERREVVHGQPLEHAGDANRGFTRRRALQLGAVTALTAMWARPSLVRAASGTPAYLRRTSYSGLVGESFSIDNGSFKLASVSDLAGAAVDPSLRGHDEAFVLAFEGAPGALDSGIHQFAHPQIGSFSLFASSVDEGDAQRYEVVVDRSVGRPADPPSAPSESATQANPAEKAAAAEALIQSTPADEVPGAPGWERAVSKRKQRRKRHRAHKARHVRHHRRRTHRRRSHRR